jgi:hypothetical protein
MKFFSEFKDEGEVIARFGDTQLVKFFDGKMELRGGSDDDHTAAQPLTIHLEKEAKECEGFSFPRRSRG